MYILLYVHIIVCTHILASYEDLLICKYIVDGGEEERY